MKRLLFVYLLIISQSAFGYNFKDLCFEIAPSEEASKAILSVLQSLENIEFDENSKSVMDFIWEGMDSDSFYFGDIYRSTYFKPAKNGYRAMTLQHIRKPGSNKIQVVPKCYEDIDVHEYNNYTGIMEFGIKSNPISSQLRQYRSFSLSFRSKEVWENAGDIQPASIADGILKIMDPTNINQMKVEQSYPLYKGIKDETRIVMDDFTYTFPKLSHLIDRYLEINNFIKAETIDGKAFDKDQKEIAYSHIEFTPAIKTKELKKDFPELAKGLNKYRKLITIDGVLKNKQGNTYGKMTITPKKTLIEGYTYQGKIIPYDENGNLIFEEAGTFETETEIIAEGEMQIDFIGVEIVFNGSVFIEHTGTPEKDFVSARIEKAGYRYSGRLLGFIPMSVIKFLSPIDIDKFADDMMYTVLQANDGEGTLASIGWEKDELRNRYSTISVSTEVLDHYMVEFLMRYARIFIGSDNRLAFEQTQDFLNKILSAVIADAKAVYSDMDYDKAGLVQR